MNAHLKIKKILLISLSNIGDVILSFPVLDILKKDFPLAKLSVVIGPKAESLLKENSCLDELIIFNKHQSALKMISWIFELRRKHFDLVIDLRNTAIPFLMGAKKKTPLRTIKRANQHMRDKHLARLRSVYNYKEESFKQYALDISEENRNFVEQLINKEIGKGQKFILIASGAASHTKRWTEQGFAEAGDALFQRTGFKIVFIGDKTDYKIAKRIAERMKESTINLCGRTSLIQLAILMEKAQCVLSNDSAPMHLASYLNKPVCALFGPTSSQQYGPWSKQSVVIKNNTQCHKCHHLEKEAEHTCMEAIKSEQVLSGIFGLLENKKNLYID